VDFKISTLVFHLLAGTALAYLADDCTLVTAGGCRPLQSADIEHAWSRDHATSLAIAVLPPLGQCCGSLIEQLRQPDITFGQLKRSFKRLCLVSWAALPCV